MRIGGDIAPSTLNEISPLHHAPRILRRPYKVGIEASSRELNDRPVLRDDHEPNLVVPMEQLVAPTVLRG